MAKKFCGRRQQTNFSVIQYEKWHVNIFSSFSIKVHQNQQYMNNSFYPHKPSTVFLKQTTLIKILSYCYFFERIICRQITWSYPLTLWMVPSLILAKIDTDHVVNRLIILSIDFTDQTLNENVISWFIYQILNLFYLN